MLICTSTALSPVKPGQEHWGNMQSAHIHLHVPVSYVPARWFLISLFHFDLIMWIEVLLYPLQPLSPINCFLLLIYLLHWSSPFHGDCDIHKKYLPYTQLLLINETTSIYVGVYTQLKYLMLDKF